MTRLTGEWMRALLTGIDAYERELFEKTGLSFAGIAAAASGLTLQDIAAAARAHTVAVVSVTQGEGIIPYFAQSIALTVQRAGFRAFATDASDADGLYEAHTRGADVVFMADDARYIAFRLDARRLCDNNEATARGFVAALEAAAGSLAGRDTLVVGLGIIGREAGKCLVAKGARTVYYDSDKTRLDAASAQGLPVERNAGCLSRYDLVFDATNTGGWLKPGMLRETAWVASPGVPRSTDDEAQRLYASRIIHDDLQIGTLSMLGCVCRKG